jgi:Tfp pilus assembly protein PilO
MVFNGLSRCLHNDYRVLINWLYQQIETQENERQAVKSEYEQRIAQTRVELADMKRQRKKLELDALIAAKQILVSALRSSSST